IEGILPECQRLIFNGIELDDGNALCDYYGMRYESVLQLALQDRGVISYFSSDSLDPQWNYDFTNVNDNGATHMRGGILYKRPCGWRRFALKVTNRYDNGDNKWLGTDNMAWPVSYHGTSEHNGKSIADEGFLLSKGNQFDFRHGIYSSPDVNLAEKYAHEFDYEGVKYVTIIQNRVNPTNLQKIPKQTGDDEYWVSMNEHPIQKHICDTSDYHVDTTLTNTRVTLLSPSDLCYVHIAQKFFSGLPRAMIKGILRIEMPYNIVKPHLDLKMQMSNAANGANVTYSMHHGTYSSCDVMNILTNLTPNCSSNCGVCGILREGNKMRHSRSGPGRMWFASDPCTSLGYCRNQAIKVMFCVDILYNTFNDIIIIEKDEYTLLTELMNFSGIFT
ncbi:1232_t:CDS:2, partial [Dentiscutata heterogama]